MEGFNVPNVEIINDSRFACGVHINLLAEDLLGEWTLIARSTRTSDAIERRLTFTIRVEGDRLRFDKNDRILIWSRPQISKLIHFV